MNPVLKSQHRTLTGCGHLTHVARAWRSSPRFRDKDGAPATTTTMLNIAGPMGVDQISSQATPPHTARAGSGSSGADPFVPTVFGAFSLTSRAELRRL